MASQTTAPASAGLAPIPVRTIGEEDLRIALRQGWDDFKAMRGDLLFAGLLYPLIGVAAAVMTTNASLLPFFVPVVAGVGLLGPVAALGFYELARRREEGGGSAWSHFLDVLKRPSADDIGAVVGLLLIVFGGWVVSAGVIYFLLFGFNGVNPTVTASIPAFLREVFTTPHGWGLIVAGAAVGAVFAWIVLAISVVSLPLLIDRDVSAARAVSTSWRAANGNRAVMIRWGLIVAALLVIGSIPLFIGLALVLPWLGYSTWHLYTRLVDRKTI